MIRLATIGTSNICNSFLYGAARTNEYELTAVYSRKYDTGIAFAKKHGCQTVFTNLEEMAKCDFVDAVYIATPNVFHYSQSKLFLENGKHVICEKPIVTNSDDYVELKKIADINNLIYMEAIVPRHIEAYKTVKSALKQIGKIKGADIRYLQRSSRLDAFLSGEQVNIFDMSLHAGALMDLGVYCVYGAVDLLGMPQDVTAQKTLLSNGADGSGSVQFDYGDFKADLIYSKVEQSNKESVILGEKGTLKLKMISQYTGVTLVIDGKEIIISSSLSKAEQMQGEAQRFADYILKFHQNKVDYEAVSSLCLEVHKCMDQIKKSAGLVYPAKKHIRSKFL